jgi:uncharacterized protein (TIGR03083 family)
MGSDAVAGAWDRPSALDGMSVGGLVAHLTMAVKALIGVFEARELASPELRAAAAGPATRRTAVSFVGSTRFDGPDDRNTEMARWVQARAGSDAAKGRDVVLQRFDRGVPDIVALLATVPPDREVTAPVNIIMTAGDYVGTRLIELVVHGDDLAASVGVEPPPFSAEVTGAVLEILVASLRQRSGDMMVIRSLTRHERADPEVLRAL